MLDDVFCESNCKNVSLYFSKKRKQSTDSAVAFKSQKDFFKLLQDFMDTVYFFQLLYRMYLYLVAYYLFSYHEKAINALHELA